MVHQHAVAAIGEIKRDVLVRLLGTGAAIAVPGFHRLAVTYQRGKALAQPVYRFTDAKIQALKHIVFPAVGILHVAVIFQLATGNTFTVTQEIQRPELAFGHPNAQIATLQFGKFNGVLYLYVDVLQHVQRVMRAGIQRALKVLHSYTHHPFLRREEAQREKWGIQLPGTFTHVTRRNVDDHLVTLLFNLKHLNWVNHIQARLRQPVSVANFHRWFLSSVILSSKNPADCGAHPEPVDS